MASCMRQSKSEILETTGTNVSVQISNQTNQTNATKPKSSFEADGRRNYIQK